MWQVWAIALVLMVKGCQGWGVPCISSLHQRPPPVSLGRISAMSFSTSAAYSVMPTALSCHHGGPHAGALQRAATTARPLGGSSSFALQCSTDGGGGGGGSGGRVAYQGLGFRVVKCFPRLARRQADQAVQVVCVFAGYVGSIAIAEGAASVP